MITMPRRLAMTLKTVFRAALHLSARGPLPTVLIESGKTGFRIRCQTSEVTAEYCTTDQPLTEQLVVPFALLSDVAANKDQPLTLEQTIDSLIARWQVGDVPQLKQYDPLDVQAEVWPAPAEELAENSSQLLAALRDASQITDPDSSRYALGCLQLSGEGQITSTNGKEMLLQTGFSFPWEGELLVPASKLFGCKHLPAGEPVQIGKSEEWLVLKVGFWTFQFKLFQEGRFPQVKDLIRSADQAIASFELPAADRTFLRQNLSRLPGNEVFNAPATVDLNGKIAVRAKAPDADAVTELVLSGASRSGKAVRFNTNRNFLSRAIELGFDRIHITSPNAPAFCLDEHRHYLWALLEPESALKPVADAIQIESGTSQHVGSNRHSHHTRRNRMKSAQHTNHQAEKNNVKTPNNSNPDHPSPSDPEAQPDRDEVSTIDRAIAVRDSLRTAASNVNDLVRVLKREKKQSRTLRSTLLSLKQLQAIDA